jgi:very-short-patch-repair endonuclease
MGRIRTLKDNTLRDRAPTMRAADTTPEARLWEVLRDRWLGGWKWKRQVPRGSYIIDFYCAEAALVVEVDGGQHSEQVGYDERRTRFLENEGLRALRFWNGDVLTNRDGIRLTILAACGGDRAG